jgi:hypothetical protein
MRRLAFALLLAACSEGGVPPTPQDDPDGGASPIVDARPAPDGAAVPDAAPPDAGFPPSTANVGWIGGACGSASQCMFAGAMCLTDGFPNGMCTRECTGTCPDRTQPRDTVTTCVDGRPFGFDQGLCVSRCNATVLPPTGCPAGYSCLNKNRYLDATRVVDVCVPTPPRGPCNQADDELIDVNYPDQGKLWIPREARCGGAFPLMVQLHGINGGMNPAPTVGGGRHIEYLVRSLIDYGVIKPVLLAEPVHSGPEAASSTGLYSEEFFEPADHLELIEAQLAPRGITLSSISYAGHSGAGCDGSNGLALVLKRYAQLIPAHAPAMKLWGLEDTCNAGASLVNSTLTGKGTAVINVWTGQSGTSSIGAFETAVIPDPADLPCATVLYSKCIRHEVQPWCVYRTKSTAMVGHEDNPFFFYREALPQVFPVDPSIVPCR